MSKRIVVHFLETFGRLHVLREISRPNGSGPRWAECICDCGSIAPTTLKRLRSGESKSCGCWKIDKLSEIHTTHGEYYSVEYRTLASMIGRCHNKNNQDWKYYGALGVKVCDEWRHDFPAFLAHVGRRPGPEYSIDRWPKKNGNYEPGNVRWAIDTQQNRNKRNTAMAIYKGEPRVIKEISEDLGINYHTVMDRRYRGWPDSRLFEIP